MNKEPLVSILMNCRNGEEFLKEAINSVYAQTYSNWEIIFWDNLSTDKSAEIAKSYGPKVKYYLSSEPTSLYKARNLAVEKVNGDYVAILDTDDIWLPTKLEKQLRVFELDNDIGAVFSDAFYFSKDSEWQLYKTRSFYTGNCFNHLIAGNFISSPSLLYKREALKSLDHIFDERFDMSGDWDLSLRIAMNHKLECVEEPLVKYRLHENNLSKKMPESIISELDQMIEKYSNLIPDFEKKYSKEIDRLRFEKSLVLAQAHWTNGNQKEAREVYLNNLRHGKSIIYFFLTFLPHNKFLKVKNKIRSFL